MRVRQVAVLALLIALAGCGGLADDGTTRAPFSVEQTAEPTATVTESATRAVFDPDPSRDEVGNVGVLLDTHERALDGTGYRVTAVYRETSWNGTVRRELVRDGSYPANRSRYRYYERAEGTTVGPTQETQLFADGHTVYSRRTIGDQTDVTVLRDSDGTPFSPTDLGIFRGQQTDVLAVAFEAVAIESVDRLGHAPRGVDDPLYRLRGDTVRDRAQLSIDADASIRDASLDLIVDEDGLIREFTFKYITTRDGQTVTVLHQLVYRDVGTTSIERPAWTQNATAGRHP
ncbi:DUF7537 family lipoprotein [Haloarchaeobius sp. DYHT-AS-18]|uniref:DUF7537 family lipoprotein n=1 Tax=Haloarchaeobius sp. DYHT-AS-18 TaxID=3446117 RepID=UPI003EBE0C2C